MQKDKYNKEEIENGEWRIENGKMMAGVFVMAFGVYPTS